MKVGNALPRMTFLVFLGLCSSVTFALGGAQEPPPAANPQATAPISDAQIEADVEQALESSNALKNEPINTATSHGEVTLSGTVSTAASRELAETLASHVAGVAKVVNNLEIGGPPAAQNGAGPAPDPQQSEPPPQAQPAPNGQSDQAPVAAAPPAKPKKKPAAQTPQKTKLGAAPKKDNGAAGQPNATAQGGSQPAQPAFDESPQAGSQQLTVEAATGSTLYIYTFTDSSPSNTKASACTLQSEASQGGTLLQIVQGSGTSQTTGSSFDVSSSTKSPFNLTLQLPLVAGAQLQLAQSSSSGTNCSDLVAVKDPNSQGPHQFFLTLGAYISNQQANSTSGSSGSSTSASQYLEAAWRESWYIPPILIGDGVKDQSGKCNASAVGSSDASGSQDPPQASGGLKYCHGAAFGISTLVAGRLASIPVSTSVTSSTSSSSGSSSAALRGQASSPTPPTTSTPTVNALNVLSSQDSFRFVGALNVPFLATRVAGSRAYTFAFTGKAGIDTLVNSSGTLTTNATSTASGQSGVPQFNQVYNFRAAGLRFDFLQAPSQKLHDQTGAAPQTIAHIDLTFGPYSNLQSYVCTNNSKLSLPSKTLATGCGTGALSSFPYPSRETIPRIEVDGSARIASTPFVVGIDANLGQYAFATGSYHVDDLNKPGNDVRIFIGTSVSISSFMSALEKIGAVVP